MEYNAPACLSKLADIAGAVGVRKSSQSLEEATFKAIKTVRDIKENVDNPLSLRQIEVEDDMIPTLAQDSMKSKRLRKHNPRDLTEDDAEELFRRMLGGKPLPLIEY